MPTEFARLGLARGRGSPHFSHRMKYLGLRCPHPWHSQLKLMLIPRFFRGPPRLAVERPASQTSSTSAAQPWGAWMVAVRMVHRPSASPCFQLAAFMQLVGEVGISAPRFAVGGIAEDLLDGCDPAFSHCRFTRGRFVGPRGRRGLCRRSTLDLTRRASWCWVIARPVAIVGVVLGSAATSSGAATGVGTASAGVWTHTALGAVAILIQVVDRKSVFGIELLAASTASVSSTSSCSCAITLPLRF